MVALMLLLPQTPMLFQGQEWACSSPFQYFIDHNPELTKMVCTGRAEFMAQFPSVGTPEMVARLPNPGDDETFQRCKLNPNERTRPGHAQVHEMYKDLLRLRRETSAFRGRWPGGLDGAVLGNHTFALRYFDPAGDDRLLVVNLDSDQHLEVAPEPLLAPPLGTRWELAWSSDHPRYGGTVRCRWRARTRAAHPRASATVLRPAKAHANEPDPLRAPPNPNDPPSQE